jgi:hypothetical protein
MYRSHHQDEDITSHGYRRCCVATYGYAARDICQILRLVPCKRRPRSSPGLQRVDMLTAVLAFSRLALLNVQV